ncbi:hypothetical protein KC351_g112 [Hortaea werneckii]|nr:hypothetical protein KC351_g112 [Hortaea werneckii]
MNVLLTVLSELPALPYEEARMRSSIWNRRCISKYTLMIMLFSGNFWTLAETFARTIAGLYGRRLSMYSSHMRQSAKHAAGPGLPWYNIRSSILSRCCVDFSR